MHRQCDIDVYVDLGNLPVFDEDLEEATRGDGNDFVCDLRQAVTAADGLVFATPEYNQSVPGILKNAIDWLSRTDAIVSKPTAIFGATTGSWGTRYAQKELRHILSSALETRVMPSPALYVSHVDELIDNDGKITDERTEKGLNRFLTAFVDWVQLVQWR